MKELFHGLKAILRDCLSIFTKNSISGRHSFTFIDSVFYVMLPGLIFIGTFWVNKPIGENISKAIINVLTIFVVLSFQVVFIATDKFSSKVQDIIEKKAKEDGQEIKLYEDEKNYLKRVGNYSRQFVRQLVLVIIVSLFIIICSLFLVCFECACHILRMAVSSLMLLSFYMWILLLLKMIVSIYNLQMDDIKQNYDLITGKEK